VTSFGRVVLFWAMCCGLGAVQCVAQSQSQSGQLSLDEAVRSVLEKHPLIRFQLAQVDVDQGLLLQAAGAFDTSVTAEMVQSRTATPLTQAEREEYALIGAMGNHELTDLTTAGFSVSRLFRSGIQVVGAVSLIRNVDNLLNPQGVNTANPNVQVTVPLLNGRGRNAVDAQEMATSDEVKAATADVSNETTALLSTAVNDYWNLVASRRLLGIARDAEERSRTDVDNTQTLVNADRLPKQDLNDMNASLAQSASSRIAAEQSLAASQYALALDIGLDRDKIESIELMPSDALPNPSEGNSPRLDIARITSYVELALRNRSDFIALKIRIDEQKVVVAAAKNHLLPNLTVTASAGYNGLQEGRRFKDIFDSTAGNVDGPMVSGGISYSHPPRNEVAIGAYRQAIAAERQLELQSLQLTHTIASAVATAVTAVKNAADQTKEAHDSVDFSRRSLTGEREKYHLGMASVVDVLTIEDRLTTALTTEVQAELSFAQSMTQLRVATGTVVPAGEKVVAVDSNIFRTIPNTESSESRH
jgi:outer membrane protein